MTSKTCHYQRSAMQWEVTSQPITMDYKLGNT